MLEKLSYLQSLFQLGIILIQKRIISEKQLQIALAEQESNGKKLGEILVQKQWVTPEQLEKALTEQKLYRCLLPFFLEKLKTSLPLFDNLCSSQPSYYSIKIGKLLVSKGYITSAQLQTTLAQQQVTGQKVGEILVEQGLLSEEKLKEVLNEQKWLNFIATFLLFQLSTMSLTLAPVQANDKQRRQISVPFSGSVPEQVKVEINPRFITTEETLFEEKQKLIKVQDNSATEEGIVTVQYESKADQYTITPR